MTNPPVLERLKRARIVQVLLVYLGASWAVIQVADFLQELLRLPDWVLPVSVILLLVGLVIILATAWIQAMPSTTRREDAGEIPTDWQIALGDVLASLKAGKLPHLTWGRAILGGIMALSFLFGGAGFWVFFTGRAYLWDPRMLGADEAATGIAVVPFSVNGEDLDVWREGMVDLLSTGLDGLGGFRSIDSRTVMARWRSTVGEASGADLDASLRVAGATGARYAVVGSAASLGGRVRLTGEVYDIVDGSKIGQAQAEGTPDQVLALADELAVNIIRELLESRGNDMVSGTQVASLSTTSVEALRSYLLGESLMRHGEFERAASAYEEAVDQDSTFAMAYYRLTSTYGWMEAGGDRVERAELALRALAENLPPRDRLLLEGEEALALGDAAGIGLMEEAAKRYPDDPDAWAMLGELLAHGGDRLFHTPGDVYRAFGSAVELDPTSSPYRIHYTQGAMLLGHPDEARALLDRYLELAPDTHQGVAMSLAYTFQFGTDEEVAEARSALDTLGLHTSSDVVNGLAHTPRGIEALRLISDVNAERSTNPRWSGTGVWTRIYTGRLDEARSLLAGLEDPAARVVEGANLRLADARASGDEPPPPASACGGHAECLHHLGTRAADEGDDVTLRAVREALSSAAVESGSAGYVEWIGTAGELVEAYAIWRAGEPSEAARTLSRLQLEPAAFGTLSSWARLWLGEIAAEQGRNGDAQRVLGSLELTPLGWYALLLRARSSARAADQEGTRGLYDRFQELWSDAPADHPFVVEARGAG